MLYNLNLIVILALLEPISLIKEGTMTNYEGYKHSACGPQLVVKNDDILSPAPSQRLYNHSPGGFQWGYPGSGPAQLALALLLDATGDPELSVSLHQTFKRDFVALWDDTWEITDLDIRLWVENQTRLAGRLLPDGNKGHG